MIIFCEKICKFKTIFLILLQISAKIVREHSFWHRLLTRLH